MISKNEVVAASPWSDDFAKLTNLPLSRRPDSKAQRMLDLQRTNKKRKSLDSKLFVVEEDVRCNERKGSQIQLNYFEQNPMCFVLRLLRT